MKKKLNHILTTIRLSILSTLLLTSSSFALAPDEILVIANAKSISSMQIAEYYCQKRNVPFDNIIKLPIKESNQKRISRSDYSRHIAYPIRLKLQTPKYAGKIKCLVTTFDTPYIIKSALPQKHLQKSITALKSTLDKESSLFTDALIQMNSLGYDWDKIPQPKTQKLNDALKRSQSQTKATLTRIEKLKDPTFRKTQQIQWFGIYQQLFGNVPAYQLAQQNPIFKSYFSKDQNASMQKNDELLRDAHKQKFSYPNKIDKGYYRAISENLGLAKNVMILKSEIDSINGKETSASLDSELSMIMFKDYPLYRWQPNELKSRVFWIDVKTLMVSRLDGPDEEIVKGIIDKAIAVEKTGLKGTAYFDSGKPGGGEYANYDRYIRNAAETVRKKTNLKVTEETTLKLFPPGSCPDTALYCGWYSLKKYIDAFDFAPGAIGYHIASFEAADLRNPQSPQWCPAMLKDGITATLGPVTEPYLAAFPKPDDFFAELIKGKTLAEAYYKTKPFNSWRMLLIGDPLYKPFNSP